MAHVTSNDGTRIGYDRIGNGPPVIFVNGALGYRDYFGQRDLAQLLSESFTVVIYDRRGRGESTNTGPYTIDREIDDIEALIDAVGGQAALYGESSGAALALKATIRLGGKASKLAMYEPPYATGAEDPDEHTNNIQTMQNQIAANDRAGMVTIFMGNFMGPDDIEAFRTGNAGEWATMEAVAPTLLHDYVVMAEQAPPAGAETVQVPVLLMNGTNGLPGIGDPIDRTAAVIPGSQRETLESQEHTPSAEVIGPQLIAFFKT